MNTTLRHLAPEESDLETLTLGTSAGALAYVGVWTASRLPMPPCAFHAITGCPCPTCGAMRCIIALLHGRIGQALGWNPLVFTGLILLAIFNLYAAAVLMGRLPRLRFSLTGWEGRFLRVASIILVAANWAYEIHRLG